MIAIKGMGMLFLFLSSVLFSKRITGKIKRRVLELEEINGILNDFIVSINIGLYDVESLINDAIKRAKTVYKKFLEEVQAKMKEQSSSNFAQLWFDCLEKYSFDINKEERILVENIGVALSFNDKNRMVKQLMLTQNSIEKQIKKASSDKDKKVSLYEKMGILFGGFLVVIFL